MTRLRNLLQSHPMAGWALASLLLLVAAFILFTRGGDTEQNQLTQWITIRCADTGDTWTLPRGAVEKELYGRPFPVDPNQGLINPKTGKPTGFPIDDWAATIKRINTERKPLAETQDGKPQPQPAK